MPETLSTQHSAVRTVLLIAYHYPPSGAVGAVRPAKFARYLPEFGWRPVVLTASPGNEPSRDEHVYRVPEWPHPLKWYERRSRRRIERAGRTDAVAATWHAPYEAVMAKPRGLKGLLLPWLRLPDQELSWLPPAVRRGMTIIREQRPSAIISTGPPFTVHLVALWLARRTGLRWLADFRDPWLLSHKYPLHRHRGTDWVERRMIEAVIRRADRVLCVTPAMTEQTTKAWPEIPKEKFVTVTGGFDPEDFAGLAWRRPAAPPVRIAYLGTFYHGRSPAPFLAAIAELLAEGRLSDRDIRVSFVGNVGIAEGQSVNAMIASHGLERLVTVEAPVARREALRRTLESHVLLVLDERHPVQVPYKVYEGLAAGTILLNIGSEGATAELLMKTGRGVAVHHLSREAIKGALLDCVQRARSENGVASAPWADPALAAFEFRSVTESVAAHLAEART